MLKALEISGFKSFADKTRFEFPPGITVVVGPNGSGKSNIVDAIKWVLGEQSAKSLRGKDMSDVIFKGSSGANARKPANSASATLVLENADGRLMADTPEVHVTRRVYRSGESEYLINNTPCRLKDVRSLFRGTGVGTDAYSLIEQGKVDRLLQASAKDRRAIFEEAAGISRFKAKKIEAERRLERVDANLLRLADIVEEVGNRYRSIKSQASKAAKYKEFSDRLKDLRTFAGRKDYRHLSQRLEELTTRHEPLALRSAELQKSIEQLQSNAHDCEQKWDAANNQAAEIQERINAIRAEQAQAESQRQLNQQRYEDLSQRLLQWEIQSQRDLQIQSELSAQRQTLQQEWESHQKTIADLTVQQQSAQRELDQQLAQGRELEEEAQRLSQRLTEKNQRSVELAQLASSLRSQVDLTRIARDKQAIVVKELESDLLQTSTALGEIAAQRLQQQQAAEENDSALRLAQQAADSLQQHLTEQRSLLSELKSRLSGVAQRAKVIDEMERRWEGINSGARGLIQKARSEPDGEFHDVAGLVADLVQVNVQHAAMVDAALGAVSQYVVLRGHHLLQAIQSGRLTVTGRAGIIAWDAQISLGADVSVDLNDHPLIIGNVFSLVQAQPDAVDFVRQLLGGTWIVKSLADAYTARETVSDRVRYITLDGEVLEADGVLIVGPKSSAEGIVSRRSELRALRREQQELQDQKKEAEDQERQWAGELRFSQMQLAGLISQNQELSRNLTELNIRQQTLEQQQRNQQSQADRQRQDWQSLEEQATELEQQSGSVQQELHQLQTALTKLQQQSQSIQANISERAQQRTAGEQQLGELRIQIASGEQRLQSQQQRLQQIDEQLTQVQSQVLSAQTQISVDQEARLAAESGMAAAQERFDATTKLRDTLSLELLQLSQARNEWDVQRRSQTQELLALRKQLQETDNQIHDNQLKRQQYESELGVLAQRLLEDYNLDVRAESIDSTAPSELENRQAVDQEISELRQKLSSLGSVNMQALQELEQLESRYLALDQQYQDLVSAKESLTRIIQRINQDSRKLFAETVEAIRVNFQKLFRQTFGGGQADIVIEEGADILEAGVEIIATPPGKPKFNNSLLSGGEKALTAVSLLMAIFQFRPSPFCVLDEVDAPFDEANIGRFVDVLKSFLGWTKFVIVTHSKKTMTAANTLYGVTMQESGVSKRVSVRFEDVSEDGHISREAIERNERSPTTDENPSDNQAVA